MQFRFAYVIEEWHPCYPPKYWMRCDECDVETYEDNFVAALIQANEHNDTFHSDQMSRKD